MPHRGSDVAYWASYAANLLEHAQLGFGTNSYYVKALQKKSPELAEISQQFIERGANLQIRTFFETKKMGNQLVRLQSLSILSATRLTLFVDSR